MRVAYTHFDECAIPGHHEQFYSASSKLLNVLNIPQNEILYLQFGLQCCWLTAAPMLPGHKLRVVMELHNSEWLGYKTLLWYLCSCSQQSLLLLMGYSSADHYGGTLMHPVFVLVAAGKNFFRSPFVVVMNSTSNISIMDIYPHPVTFAVRKTIQIVLLSREMS